MITVSGEATIMDLRALEVRAEDHGCNTCNTRGGVFYAVQFYVLPARLVRKRHKERQQLAVYCRSCYETSQALPFLVDGRRFTVSKAGLGQVLAIGDESGLLPALECTFCGSPFGHRCLYGLLSSTLWMHGSMIEANLLAHFCETCVESHRISLVAKLAE